MSVMAQFHLTSQLHLYPTCWPTLQMFATLDSISVFFWTLSTAQVITSLAVEPKKLVVDDMDSNIGNALNQEAYHQNRRDWPVITAKRCSYNILKNMSPLIFVCFLFLK